MISTFNSITSGCLSDKDIQLLKKTYRKLTELYYENKKNQSLIRDLINFSHLITQVISTGKDSEALSLTSIMEILKVKSKSQTELIMHIDATIQHLKNPKQNAIKYDTLLYSLQKSELFEVGCTIAIRFYDKINSTTSEIDWKYVIAELSKNISINPWLCIELLFHICNENELHCRVAVKQGLVKFIFLSYIGQALQNKLNLYRAIKLLKVIATAERTLLKQRQKSFALIIYTYDDYIPIIEEICNKCYDSQYGQVIDSKRKFDQTTIDQPYLWSYTESFCLKNLSQQTIQQFVKTLQSPLNEERETKTYGILSNYCKYRKIVLKQCLQMLPKNEKSLLNYIKLCLNCCEVDQSNISHINFNGLQQLVDKSSNPKVDQLFKYLKESRNKDSKIGFLSDNVKKMFDMQKNADFMMERASKIPQNNDQLDDIKRILKQKDRSNQFQSDTLRTVKERALNSLHTAILQKKKLNLNPILQQMDLSDVLMLAKLLQILELNLMMNDELIGEVNVQRIFQIIQWIEDHYKGELIEWGPIGQLIIILEEEGEWKKHLHQITEHCFWLLGIEQLNQQDENAIFNKLMEIIKNIKKYQTKIPFIVGFLGKILSKESKLKLYSNFRPFFELISANLKTNNNYKSNLLHISYFIKDWYVPEAKNNNNNLIFESILEPLVAIVVNNFRSIEQEYEVLQNALPYKFKNEFLHDNLDYLIGLYGKLASYIYKGSRQKGESITLSYDRIKTIGRIGSQKSRNILQILIFLQDNSQILQEDQLSIMLDNLVTKRLVYWCVYPNFYNIISKLLVIISKTTNPIITSAASAILYKVLVFVATNQDVSVDEKTDLYEQIKQTLESLNGRVVIDKNKIKKAIDKIAEPSVKEQLLQIINNYKCPVQPEVTIQISPSKQKKQNPSEISKIPSKIPISEQKSPVKNDNTKNQDNWQDLEKNQDVVDIFQQLAKMTDKASEGATGEMTIIQAMRQLKKIIQKTLPVDKFNKLNQVFLKNTIKGEQVDILGYLLCKFYPICPQKDQEQVLKLFLMKDKTQVSKESCFQLLSKQKSAFVLSKRWRLTGHEWINLAMTRLYQGFYIEGSLVTEYNLLKSADLQYFFSKKYHQIVLSTFYKIKKAEDLVNFLVLIGTSARLTQIKQYYLKDKLHIKILYLVPNYTQSSKLIANIYYALSSLVYMQPQACLELVKQKVQMQNLLQIYKHNSDTKSIVQSGACLIANIAYSNEEIKQILNQMNIVEVILTIFQNALDNPQISTFKQLIRALGNLSLSKKLSMQLIDQHFCALAYRMVQKLDIFVNFDDKKASLMKMLIDLIANLAAHRYELGIFHKQKLTLFILTLLETTQSHPNILTACIDTIDCLCQNSQIENYVVTEKKILYLLIDVLKMQSDEKIVVKSTRLLTNLTINQSCIPYILEANLLSVLANIVMPHFYGNKLATEQNKKMETYVQKILTRIFMSKQNKDLILKSGYLDCLIRTIQTTENIQDAYIEILYHFSEYMPSFLNKRSFICLIRVLTKKIQNKEVTSKCLRTIKNLSTLYEKDEGDVLIEGTSQMYERILNGDIKEDGLSLLALHLLRSHKLRAVLQKKSDSVLEIVKKLSQDAKYIDLCRLISFVVYNPYNMLQQTELQPEQIHYNILKKGFKCNLFRIDGSCKKAIIDINEQYQIRTYKYPDGEIKSKYLIDIKNLKDYQFNYPVSDQLWNSTVFTMQRGLFDSKKVNPKNCCSLVGNIKWGEVSFINVEFESTNDKVTFFQSLSQIFNSLR